MQDAEVLAGAHALPGQHLWRNGTPQHWRASRPVNRRQPAGEESTPSILPCHAIVQVAFLHCALFAAIEIGEGTVGALAM